MLEEYYNLANEPTMVRNRFKVNSTPNVFAMSPATQVQISSREFSASFESNMNHLQPRTFSQVVLPKQTFTRLPETPTHQNNADTKELLTSPATQIEHIAQHYRTGKDQKRQYDSNTSSVQSENSDVYLRKKWKKAIKLKPIVEENTIASQLIALPGHEGLY